MLRIGTADHAFFRSFQNYYPSLDVISEVEKVHLYDLIIFPGGEDINPNIYGENNLYSSYSSSRDNKEIVILNRALRLRKFILGVCRGHQLIVAMLGGSLYQDLYLQKVGSHPSRHKLDQIDDNDIERFFQNGVNSLHHQGVKRMPRSIDNNKNLQVTSYYNGIPESTRGEGIITVQFHPEFMERSTEFFDWVLELAAKNKDNKKGTKTQSLKATNDLYTTYGNSAFTISVSDIINNREDHT